MQKKIIALAIAGLASGAAFAQSNVTIYGVADVGMAVSNAGNGSQARAMSGQSAGSRLGFKGDEALGNGLKAVFVMEMGLDLTNGSSTCHSMNDSSCGKVQGGASTGSAQVNSNNTTNTTTGTSILNRQAFAGLSSDTLGTVTVGRQYVPSFYTKLKSDAFGLGTAATANNAWAQTQAFVYDRADRAFNYVTPNFAGFQGTLMYSTGQQNNNDGQQALGIPQDAGRLVAGNVGYTGYGFDVGMAYHVLQSVPAVNGVSSTAALSAVQNDGPRTRGFLLGGNYDFKSAKVFAGYATSRQEKRVNDGSDANLQDTVLWNVGVKVPFGAHSVAAQYSNINDRTTTNADAKVWGLGYEYAMSKRTALYTAYSRMNNNGNANYALQTATNTGLAVVNNDGTARLGYGASEVNVGMRHSF